MGKYIGHRLVARPEPDNTFWTAGTHNMRIRHVYEQVYTQRTVYVPVHTVCMYTHHVCKQILEICMHLVYIRSLFVHRIHAMCTSTGTAQYACNVYVSGTLIISAKIWGGLEDLVIKNKILMGR